MASCTAMTSTTIRKPTPCAVSACWNACWIWTASCGRNSPSKWPSLPASTTKHDSLGHADVRRGTSLVRKRSLGTRQETPPLALPSPSRPLALDAVKPLLERLLGAAQLLDLLAQLLDLAAGRAAADLGQRPLGRLLHALVGVVGRQRLQRRR